MSEIEDLLRRSFEQRSTEIVATPDLLDRARQAAPTDRTGLRRPRFQALAAAAAVVIVVASAWLGIQAGSRAATPVPSHAPAGPSQPAVPSPGPSKPTPAVSPAATPAISPAGDPSARPDPTAPVPGTTRATSGTPSSPTQTVGSGQVPGRTTGPLASPVATHP